MSAQSKCLALTAFLLIALLTFARPASGAAPCCDVTAIDVREGIVTAQVRATGQVFRFQVKDAGLMRGLQIGHGVFANLRTGQVSLDGRAACCAILSPPATASTAAPAKTAPASVVKADSSQIRVSETGTTAVATRGKPASEPTGQLAGGAGAGTPPCVIESDQLAGSRTTAVSAVRLAAVRLSPPRPRQTNAQQIPAAAALIQPSASATLSSLSTQLCDSLKTGTVTGDEITAMLGTMELNHAHKHHTQRKRHKVGPVSYTYEYALDLGKLSFYQQPGTGYCSDFDWQFKVRNLSQQNFTVFSTTGEVGVCASPGFGLFYIPGLSTVQPYPVPGLCFDDAAITRLDLRNVNDEFEAGLVELVDKAFARLQRSGAKVCVIGAAYPPWFTPVIVPAGQMVAYCTSTRNCEVDAAQLVAAFQGGGRE